VRVATSVARSARWSAAPSVQQLAPAWKFRIVVEDRVVVGEPLPPTVVLRPVPNYTEYRYAVVNDRRVIVEPRTRRVVKIID
jgi:hypothetical protein